MPIDMSGHIDDVFRTETVARYAKSGARDADGVWIDSVETTRTHAANVQPVSQREFATLTGGNERIQDTRKLYINDGTTASVQEADEWVFLGERWRCLSLDNRPWHNYCKVVVARLDVQ